MRAVSRGVVVVALYSIVSEVVMIAAALAAVAFVVYLLRVMLVEELRGRRTGKRSGSPRAAASIPSPLGRRVALLLPDWLSHPDALHTPGAARRSPRRG